MAEAWRHEVLDRVTRMFSPGRSASEHYLSAAAQAWPRVERGTDGISPACIISQCVGQKSGSAGLSAQGLSGPKPRCWTGLLLRDALGNYALVTCLNCWQSSSPFSCRSKVTIFLLAVGWEPSFFSCDFSSSGQKCPIGPFSHLQFPDFLFCCPPRGGGGVEGVSEGLWLD